MHQKTFKAVIAPAVLAPAMIAAVIGANPASAQDWQFITESSYAGAMGCNDNTGLCLSLGCDEGTPLRWDLAPPPGTPISTQPIIVEILVNNANAGRVFFNPMPGDYYSAPFSPGDLGLLTAMQRGNFASMFVVAGTQPMVLDLGLSGSTAATQEALLICGVQ